jgi:very-short-patch-repair endonuclease
MGYILLGQTNKRILSNKLQRRLRNEMTDAERALWKVLRGRQISGLKFRRQHPFGDYILDFICLQNKLVIEVDGGQHGGRTKYDEIRTRNLLTDGFRVLRFWNTEVLQEIEAVRERIWRAVQEQQSHPFSDPPPVVGSYRLEGEDNSDNQ